MLNRYLNIINDPNLTWVLRHDDGFWSFEIRFGVYLSVVMGCLVVFGV